MRHSTTSTRPWLLPDTTSWSRDERARDSDDLEDLGRRKKCNVLRACLAFPEQLLYGTLQVALVVETGESLSDRTVLGLPVLEFRTRPSSRILVEGSVRRAI